MKRNVLRGAVISFATAMTMALSGTAQAIETTSTTCVELPALKGLAVGVATALTGPIGPITVLPALTKSKVCGTVSCEYTGSIVIDDEAPSFPGCALPLSIDADGAGTCTVVVTRTSGLLAPKVLFSKVVAFADQDTVLPAELCLTQP